MHSHLVHAHEIPWRDKPGAPGDPGRRGRFKLLSDLHGLTQFEVRITLISPGETNTWQHRHSHIEEWFLVLRGSCHLHMAGRWMLVTAGDSIAASPGDFHMFRNFGGEDCEIVMVGTNDARDSVERTTEPAPPARV